MYLDIYTHISIYLNLSINPSLGRLENFYDPQNAHVKTLLPIIQFEIRKLG